MWSSKLPFICFVLFEHWHSCSMMFSSWLFNKSWQWLYSTCFTQFEASRDNCIGLVRFCSTILARLVRKSISQQNRCSILFDCRTQSNDWSSIGFDWFIVRLDRSGICYAQRSPKVTLITVFVSIVAWKQARWPPLFITFLTSPCLVTSTYLVSSEIYGGIFY